MSRKLRDRFADRLWREEKHPVRTPNGGYWRWTCLDESRPETMSDLPRDVFERLPREAANRPPWLYTTRRRAHEAAAEAMIAALQHIWDTTPAAPEVDGW
jgi:hypothetical protein